MVAAVEMTESLQRDPLASDVSAVADAVTAVAGSGTKQSWELVTDNRGDKSLRLRLQGGFGGEATADFRPGELAKQHHLEERVRSLKEAMTEVSLWQASVNDLLADIRQWLQSLDGDPYVEEQEIWLHEMPAGEYRTKKLMVRLGDREMIVRPVARWIVGAFGRVDIEGPEGLFTLVRMDGGGGWFWVEDKAVLGLVPLDHDIFLELARDCLGLS